MSPPQAQGQEVDQRSDIFSFGAVLYELCSGRQPFEGDYEAAVLYSLVHEAPAPLPESTQVELKRIVFKCLEKQADDRFQSAEHLLADLQKLKKEIDSGSSHSVLSMAVEPEKSIIVLPFDDLSPNKDNEYFSDGLTDEIITDLSQVRALRVISRNSAMILKGTEKTLNEIGRELDVQYALRSSVRKAGNNLRITAQLLDTGSDSHIWAGKYKGTLDDIFNIQERVSREIVEALKLSLTDAEEQKMAERPIQDANIYEYYLQAKYELLQGTAENMERALQILDAGIKIVGENPLLLWGKGYIYWMYVNAGIKADAAYLDETEKYAKKILDMEPGSAHGLRLTGLVYMHRGDFKNCAHFLKQAIAKDPNDLEALGWLGAHLSIVGKTDGARPLLEHLLRMDPLTALNHLFFALPPYYDGQFAEAVNRMQISYQLESAAPAFRFHYFLMLAAADRFDEAFEIVDQLEADTPDDFFSHFCPFLRFALAGKKAKALRVVTEKLRSSAILDLQYSWVMADGYALSGETDEAFFWLENAMNLGNLNYPFLEKLDPWLENLRSQPQFRQFAQRMKQEWENFKP